MKKLVSSVIAIGVMFVSLGASALDCGPNGTGYNCCNADTAKAANMTTTENYNPDIFTAMSGTGYSYGDHCLLQTGQGPTFNIATYPGPDSCNFDCSGKKCVENACGP